MILIRLLYNEYRTMKLRIFRTQVSINCDIVSDKLLLVYNEYIFFQELKRSLAPSTSNLRTTLLDPCVNLLFQKMQSQIKELQTKLEKAEEELNAWSFTADSVTGKVIQLLLDICYSI